MALDASDKYEIARWSGTVATTEEADLEARLAVLVHPAVVALERLQIRVSDLTLNPDVRSGSHGVASSGKVTAATAKVGVLLQYLTGDGAPTLNGAAQALVDSASSSDGGMRPVTVERSNPRAD